jgi:hypothetical protein
LARRLFAAKTPFIGYWISLDFLGFLSSESKLINGLHGINRQKFFWGPLSVASAPPGRWLTILARGEAGSLMAQAYPDF